VRVHSGKIPRAPLTATCCHVNLNLSPAGRHLIIGVGSQPNLVPTASRPDQRRMVRNVAQRSIVMVVLRL